ncbi:unnamed protein product, partial [Symbiodinium pilosum]
HFCSAGDGTQTVEDHGSDKNKDHIFKNSRMGEYILQVLDWLEQLPTDYYQDDDFKSSKAGDFITHVLTNCGKLPDDFQSIKDFTSGVRSSKQGLPQDDIYYRSHYAKDDLSDAPDGEDEKFQVSPQVFMTDFVTILVFSSHRFKKQNFRYHVDLEKIHPTFQNSRSFLLAVDEDTCTRQHWHSSYTL